MMLGHFSVTANFAAISLLNVDGYKRHSHDSDGPSDVPR